MTLDLVFFLIVFVFGMIGFFSGFWMQVMRLGALILAYLMAGFLGRPLGSALGRWLGIPAVLGSVLAAGLAFFLLYAILSGVGWAVLRRIERRRKREEKPLPVRRMWERLAGAGLGAAKTFLILFVLFCAVVLVEEPLSRTGPILARQLKESQVAGLARSHNLLAGLHLPVIGNLRGLARMSTDPGFRSRMMQDPKVRKLLNHPKIQSLANDQALLSASRRNDIAAILANPRLNQVLEDPEIRELLSKIDLSGI